MPIREEQSEAPIEVGQIAAAPGSRTERIVEWCCEPLLERIPRSVHPNTISIVTHLIGWLTAAVAVASVRLPPPERALALLAAAVGTLASMIGDCLDGMHARKTDQCTKLGEMMDHWLDAVVVPLAPLGVAIALGMPAWAIASVNISAAMVYQAQLVLYHHKGRFIHPDAATGTSAQLGIAVGYVAMAALFYFVGRDHVWLDTAVALIGIAALYIEARCNWFYYVRLGSLLRHHVPFVVLCAGFGALYLLGAIDLYAFSLSLVCTSFRISGTYVLFTIVKRPYDGLDFGIAAFLAAMFAVHFLAPTSVLGPLPAEPLLAYAACCYMLGRNFVDFSRYYRELKPSV
jgi:phosphatidylglycerophosphate synthase